MYQLLPLSDGASSEDIKFTQASSGSSKSKPVSLWALVACIVCTIANLACNYIFPPPLPQSVAYLLKSPRLTRQEISRLRHPTQFIGLDRIHEHLSSDVKPFVNKPFLSARINQSAPDKSFFDIDQRGYATPIGTVFPNHHRILATPTVSGHSCNRPNTYHTLRCQPSCSSAQSTMGWRLAS